MTRPFVCIASDYDWIGPITWDNSNTMPHQDMCSCRLVRYWGGFVLWGYDPSRWLGTHEDA
jgi:hypothetical protein